MNCTFEDLANRLSGTVLAGAGLYDTNAGAMTCSGSVIMEIYTTNTTNQAEQLLSMLTHDHSGKGDRRQRSQFPVPWSIAYLTKNVYKGAFTAKSNIRWHFPGHSEGTLVLPYDN